MADENKNLVSMAQQFSGLPMRALVGAPLIAAAQANSEMALTQTRFLLDTCFEKVQEGESQVFRPIMVNMTVTRSVIDKDGHPAQDVESRFSLPLMTLIPLNSLAVDEVNVYFEMEVVSSFSQSSKIKASQSSDNKEESRLSDRLETSDQSTELTGSVAAMASKHASSDTEKKQSNAARYEITTHASQLPLPKGVTAVIDAYTQCIAPIQSKD
ncbi:DUF2589 domain-containing protein [Enterovibrio coralii]|uniref:DUF2589 domain-containing protein n=1 Tax=Enterovibrio coralii TaxID=294935 RepID=A0A135IA32_9GAMM|nr:DUF2589 domain-containing protein [Enterovibrio coralii]KXF82315.1 hypothetical protein ATN88_09120 [Enterovibrio coralii]